MKKLCVIGSINMDIVAIADKLPNLGETVIGNEFMTCPGGKGANQAVAASRLCADVRMVGKVGDDMYGSQYIDILSKNGVKHDSVFIEKETSTGIAVIEVDKNGQNHIIIISGANGKVDTAFIENQKEKILEGDIFLFQLEIPLDAVIYAMRLVKEKRGIVILDPAPARELPEQIYKYIDFITPNETEIETLTGIKISNEKDLKEAAQYLLSKGIKNIIAKAGKKGAYIINDLNFKHIPTFDVKAVDTTAAGDSFNAGFAFALSQGKSIEECVRFANAVGALSTTAKGAQSAMPTLKQVKKILAENRIL
jgi:ribokinase